MASELFHSYIYAMIAIAFDAGLVALVALGLGLSLEVQVPETPQTADTSLVGECHSAPA